MIVWFYLDLLGSFGRALKSLNSFMILHIGQLDMSFVCV